MSDIYCNQILNGKLAVEVVAETPNVLAFHHSQPYWEVHLVVVPKKHIESITHLSESDKDIVLEINQVLADLTADVEVSHGGCRVSTNVGTYQSSRHVHWYIHAGKRLRNENGETIKTKSGKNRI